MYKEYTEVFKMSNLIPVRYIIPFFFLFASIYIILISYKNRLHINIGLLIYGIGLMLLSVLYIYGEVYMNIRDVYIPYNKKDYKIIEGKVENLHLGKKFKRGYDSFKVDNKKFSYESIFLLGPYGRRACDGGFIRKEGQHVKIYYIPIEYDEGVTNHIVGLFLDSDELENLKKE